MHAHVTSARLAPKKANLMAKMVRGMPVPEAVELLRRTGKKSARMFETLIRSAVANASHNFKQNPQSMIVKTVVVNQGSALRRGIPMARGRVRPIRKFLCHISVTLGYQDPAPASKKIAKKEPRTKTVQSSSQDTKKPVKVSGSRKKKESAPAASSDSTSPSA